MDDSTYTLEFEKPLRELEKQLIALQKVSEDSKVDVRSEIKAIESKLEQLKSNVYSDLLLGNGFNSADTLNAHTH